MIPLIPRRWPGRLCTAVFWIGLVFTVSASIRLVVQLPADAPLGGPDEPMHRSLVEYLVQHSTWPSWSADELERYSNGTSYATGSSLGYWIEALLIRATGVGRLSGLLLLFVCLTIVGHFARDCPMAGLLGIAAFTPQVLFVFSYVNSDAWSAAIMFVLGIAMARFRHDPTSTRNIVLFFTFAAASMTCRQHVWVIGLLGFVYALLPRLSLLALQNPKAAGLALVPALLIAAWWPVTSYLANDGDLLGFASGRQARQLFGDPGLPSLARPWDQIDLPEYLSLVSRSFYAVWGWGTMFLEFWYYSLAVVLAGPVICWLCWRLPRMITMFLVFPIVNLSLLIFYATTYDYQWQGRYLFPSFFLLLGTVLEELKRGHVDSSVAQSRSAAQQEQSHAVFRWGPVFLLTGLVSLNMLATVSLGSRLYEERTAHVSQGLHLTELRKYDKAVAQFQRALKKNPRDTAAHNGLGLVRAEQGDVKAARSHFEQSIALAPDDPAAYRNLGVSFLSQRELEKAIEQFETASRLAPDSAIIHYHLASSFNELGKLDAAIEHCRKALRIDPDYEPGQDMLSYLENRRRKASPSR